MAKFRKKRPNAQHGIGNWLADKRESDKVDSNKCPGFPDCPKVPSYDNPACRHCPRLPKRLKK